jgi:hypothetical protein
MGKCSYAPSKLYDILLQYNLDFFTLPERQLPSGFNAPFPYLALITLDKPRPALAPYVFQIN